MAQSNNRILSKMLDRLFAAMVNGPNLNCRPHASRQRIDLTQLSKLSDRSPEDVLRDVLGEARGATLRARVAPAKPSAGVGKPRRFGPKPSKPDASQANAPPQTPEAAEAAEADRPWLDQRSVLAKLRTIAEDARTYEQDTGVHVLSIGFPLLSLPPGSFAARDGAATRRVLAPIAFIPVSLLLKQGAAPSLELSAREGGIDRVSPNTALLAWLEQQSGKAPTELFADEEGHDTWRELREVTRYVAKTFNCPMPQMFEEPAPTMAVSKAPASPHPTASSAPNAVDPVAIETTVENICDVTGKPQPLEDEPPQAIAEGAPEAPKKEPVTSEPAVISLTAAPRGDDLNAGPAILPSAVLGLFPMANQGLLRDMQAMAAGEKLAGPVQSFIERCVSLERAPMSAQDAAEAAAPPPPPASAAPGRPLQFSEDRFVSAADPCQARAVRLARGCSGLVIHGPPGTGKSQTITNIIGDHLARGQRVLMVCDKRTALDVVANRLAHLELGRFCALVHDPQRDQRELYRTLRQQLEELPEARSDPKAADRLAKADAELQKIHGELTQYHQALSKPADDHGLSFHDLVGQWLQLGPSEAPPAAPAAALPLTLVESQAQEIEELLKRARSVELPSNPWSTAAGGSLGQFLARPMDEIRRAVAVCASTASAADATAHAAIAPFASGMELATQAAARHAIAKPLEALVRDTDPAVRARWAGRPAGELGASSAKLTAAAPLVQTVQSAPLDAELALGVTDRAIPTAQFGQQLATLASYIDAAQRWTGFFAFKQKSEAAKVLNAYGMTLSPDNARRCHGFLTGLRARIVVAQLVRELDGSGPTNDSTSPAADDVILHRFSDHMAMLDFLMRVAADPSLALFSDRFAAALRDPAKASELVDGLRRSAARADALGKLEAAMSRAGAFEAKWSAATAGALRGGSLGAATFAALSDRVDTLEGVLRLRDGLAALPEPLRGPVKALVTAATEPDDGINTLRRDALAGEIARRLAADPALQSTDGRRIAASFERYRALETSRRQLVRDAVQHRWLSRQRERLLATTGSRLNGLGADLRRRLTSRGERAMRLRQVVGVGKSTPDGDPLFDLCPVWMCSPETVAQIFPREPIFDLVVFDEASQCRLEEALPVLLRAPRVVIAGDPRQLPPTRFFESAIAASEDEEPETDQQLFELQQGEVEDLLEAALGLDINQCYLDVHYRSRNADLIAFSNQHFYSSRLVPIPAHPSRRALVPPLRLHPVEGVYDDRRNEPEAGRVVEIVRELLRGAQPPSIGIACFNLPQRDCIVEKLEEAAMEDERFAGKLAAARTREGAGSFEGLFVKNLENVQGDERDHIIISTTYGPDVNGRFYRRFGPLAQPGGGRRLNVLVTRAREAVHVVTSIPPDAYRNLPPLGDHQTPGGGWLLFAYLRFAEQLAPLYETPPREGASAEPHGGNGSPVAGGEPASTVHEHPTASPSSLARSVADRLAARHGVPSDLYWGNEGFCVDVALRENDQPESFTVGVLCDGTRYTASGDPTEWDIFRTGVLESQGWRLHRLWSPHLFRDPNGCEHAVLAECRKTEPASSRIA